MLPPFICRAASSRHGLLATSMALAAALSLSSVASAFASLGDEGAAAPRLTAHLEAAKTHSPVLLKLSAFGAGSRLDRRSCPVATMIVLPVGDLSIHAGPPAHSAVLGRVRLDENGLAEMAIPEAAWGTTTHLGIWLSATAESPATWTTVALPPLDPRVATLAPPPPGTVVITEFMKDPAAVSDTRGEWVEVHNRGSAPVDLEGWTLRDDGSNSTVLSAGGAGIVVPPAGYIVLGRSGDAAVNGGVTVDATYSGFFLGNGADQIILETQGAVPVTRVDYLDGPGWPDVAGESVSLSPRFIGTTAAVLGAAWCGGVSELPAGDRGTPGEANDDCL